MSKTTKEFATAIKDASKEKTSAYDTTAEVRRIEGNTAWVHIPGGVDETPAKLTIAASVGDSVQVRVSGGSAFLVGNGSAPPTDDTVANTAIYVANTATEESGIAHKAAEEAQASAATAQSWADEARTAALDAGDSARDATISANAALSQLGVVEDVVGVLDLLREHGDYQATSDTAVQPEKWYFERTGSGTTSDPYKYDVISNPEGEPSAEGWYELIGIDQAIQNYVSSHLAITDRGLWIQSGSNTKILLSSLEGVIMYNADGRETASYGSAAIIGDKNGFHIKIDNQEIGFYQGENNQTAYMNSAQLYVENALSFGSFIFMQRANNHFTLKRIT